MSQKTGRNQPCPCGSGKKFKRCCMNSDAKTNPDALHKQLQECSGRLMPALYAFFRKGSSPEAMEQAWQEFTAGHPLAMDEDQRAEIEELFFPWMFFSWKPEGRKLTVAEHFLSAFAAKTERLSRELILEACRCDFGYYQILQVTPGDSIELKELSTGKSLLVREQLLSKQISSSGILFARLVEIRGELFIFGCAPWILDASHADELAALEGDVKVLLKRYFDLRQEIFKEMEQQADEMVEAVLEQTPIEETVAALEAETPAATEETAADDADLQVWQLECTPLEAYEALKTLAGRKPSDEVLLAEAGYDSNGVLQSFTVPWVEKQQTLAELMISEQRMSVRCEAEQLEAIERRIRRRLSKKASLL